TISRAISRARGCERSRAQLFLLLLSSAKPLPRSRNSGRFSDSIRITSAPSIARYLLVSGPAMTQVNSTTRTPLRGWSPIPRHLHAHNALLPLFLDDPRLVEAHPVGGGIAEEGAEDLVVVLTQERRRPPKLPADPGETVRRGR